MRDPLYGNKVAAAILVVLLLAVGLPVVVSTLSELAEHAGAHHEFDEENPFGLAYIPAEISLEGGAAAVDEPEVDLGTLLASADAERGARSAAICSSCHSFDQGGPNGTGPNLWDVVGRPVASHPGYAYSSALQSLGGEWTYEQLDPYLENSQSYVPGTQMAQRISKEEKRADILAYLQTLSTDPVPFPEPAPIEETAEGEEDVVDAEEEAAEAAADTIDFEAAEPGEAVIGDETEVNERGDDGFPGDIAKEGSSYRSSDEPSSSPDVPDQTDAEGLGEDLTGDYEGSGLPDVEAARESYEETRSEGVVEPEARD
ncbi:c-type cytochrome [Parvularcula oceani]|uniref:c-type cytochrome n=1 Tax=Parvularcula oceani TaxID=1247963 RepID=UPI00068957B6|nr:cytochrome c family protein [Parvularcula oceani]